MVNGSTIIIGLNSLFDGIVTIVRKLIQLIVSILAKTNEFMPLVLLLISFVLSWLLIRYTTEKGFRKTALISIIGLLIFLLLRFA